LAATVPPPPLTPGGAVDRNNHRVQVLRYSDGAHVRTIGSGGSGNGQFSFPYGGIAIDSALLLLLPTFSCSCCCCCC